MTFFVIMFMIGVIWSGAYITRIVKFYHNDVCLMLIDYIEKYYEKAFDDDIFMKNYIDADDGQIFRIDYGAIVAKSRIIFYENYNQILFDGIDLVQDGLISKFDSQIIWNKLHKLSKNVVKYRTQERFKKSWRKDNEKRC